MEEKQTDKYRKKLFFNDEYSLMKADYPVMNTAIQSHHLKVHMRYGLSFFKCLSQTKLFKNLAFDLHEVIVTGAVF